MSVTIEKVNKEKCTGCGACRNICPVNAICMKLNSEGFPYPEINLSICTRCGKCIKVCDYFVNKEYEYAEIFQSAYIFSSTDEKLLGETSSGGFFTTLCKMILENQGIVCSPGFDKNWNLRFTFISQISQIPQICGSKYIEAEIADAYKKCLEYISFGKRVLFSGTPCQVRGLLLYLKEKQIVYKNNLITVAIICHGNVSPKYWKRFIDKISEKGAIQSINFREKTYGYKTSTLSIYYKDGQEYHESYDNGFYLPAFFGGLSIRKCCYQCSYKSVMSDADFVIGDYWPPLVNNNGQTIIVPHSSYAKQVMNSLHNYTECKMATVTLEEALRGNGQGDKKNGCWIYSAKKPEERNTFFLDAYQMEWKKLQKKYFPKTFIKRLKKVLRPVRFRLQKSGMYLQKWRK